ncbi:MAG: FkbM family methyltransferase [Magnetococcales bacterium]|nr:FkbM family methyltransferase [Magnetococcales bacterium]
MTDNRSYGPLNALADTRLGHMLYNRHDLYIGRSLQLYGEYSHGETLIFQILARPDFTVLDIGANIGYHTLFFARKVGPRGQVIAFEPQRMIHQLLCANMALNSIPNVWCHQAAVGAAAGSITVPALDYGTETNFGGLGLDVEGTVGETVAMMTVDSLNLARCHFIKIDVEGMELAVLEGAQQTIRKHRPILYLENDRQDKSPPLISWLLGEGYRLYWYLTPLYNADNYLKNKENIFGIIRSVNVLAVPGDFGLELDQFQEIKTPGDWYKPTD